MIQTDLKAWYPDGRGSVTDLGSGEFEVNIESPFTLWCPQQVGGDVQISFDCNLLVPNSAMLLMACARNWKDKSVGVCESKREGSYAEYAYDELEMYTMGFNRASHVTTDVQPNANTANVRRIGGPAGLQHRGLDLSEKTPQMMQRWRDWDHDSLLCSAYEPATGIGEYYRYAATFEGGRLSLSLDGETLLVVIDHKPEPLTSGFIAIRNMTPGGKYRLRNLSIDIIE